MAGAPMRSFEKYDSFFDESELFYYATVLSSFDRGMGGLGIRYKDDEIGFDASVAGSYPKGTSNQILDICATVLFFPYTDYLYGGFGTGVILESKEKINRNTYVKATLGLEKRFDIAGNYFAEATLQSLTNFNPKKPTLTPGFRLGVGY